MKRHRDRITSYVVPILWFMLSSFYKRRGSFNKSSRELDKVNRTSAEEVKVKPLTFSKQNHDCRVPAYKTHDHNIKDIATRAPRRSNY